MPIVTKTPEQIELMRRAAKLAVQIVEKMRRGVKPGVQTWELDAVAETAIAQAGAVSICKNYPTYRPGEGFPGFTCISVNDEIVHGVPGMRALNAGDIVTLDVSVVLDDWNGSSASTVPVGHVSSEVQHLLDVNAQAIEVALALIEPGRKWSEVARAIQKYVESHGFKIIRHFVGHGIGRSNIEEPKLYHFVDSNTIRDDFRLRPGMTLTIEPIVVMGSHDVDLLDDNWTVVTKDGGWGSHMRQMVAITNTGRSVLTA